VKNYLAKQIYSALFYPFLFVLFLWIVFFIQINTNYNFYTFGVLPRDSKGLLGIFTSVFVHENLNHIASNTIPLLVLGMMLFYFYKKIAKASFMWIWFISGLWLWIGGRNNALYPNYHIGASTLIYGLATFLFFSGLFRRHLRLMVVSTMVVFLYGSIMWGIFPLKTEISWEGHLFGAIAGVLVAFNYRKEGPQRRVYQWEEEIEEEAKVEEIENDAKDEDKLGMELPNIEPLQNQNEQNKPLNNFTIQFIYKEKNKEEGL
jgi:membrane associated rhomboid family serine protease